MKKEIRNNIIVAVCTTTFVLSIMNSYRINLNEVNARHANEIKIINKKYKQQSDKMMKDKQELIKKNDQLNKENEGLKNQMKSINEKFPILTSTLSRGGSILYLGKIRATAYSLAVADCEKGRGDAGYGITTSGKYVTPWQTVAMDKSIPFGTRVYIPYFKDYPNHGVFINEDHGGAIEGNRIDIFMEDSKECDIFGVKYLDIYVIK